MALNVVEIRRRKLKMKIHISYTRYQKIKKDYEDWDFAWFSGFNCLFYRTQLVKAFYKKYEL